MDEENILIKADFNPIVKTYIVMYVFFIMLVTNCWDSGDCMDTGAGELVRTAFL
jgi:hypothetical protein